MEVWKTIEGYEGLYEVSNLGRVRSLDRVVTQRNRWGNITPHLYRGKILSARKNCKNDYVEVHLFKSEQGERWYRVHRLVAETFIPNPNGYIEVNHIDENKSNNIVENLEWCDRRYNTNYGDRNVKIRNAVAKLSPKDIEKIKLLRDNKSVREIAHMFGISETQVYRILKGVNWRDIS